MWKFVYICSCVTLLAFYSCRQDSLSTLPALEKAEALMEEHPDSSLAILQNVNSPENLSDGQYATWCLLLTEAKDKTFGIHTSDSLISVAANYFEKQKDIERKAKVWYYMGRVNQDMEQYQDAVRYYQKAITYADKSMLNKQLMLIYNHLSNIYRTQRLYNEALSFAKKAVEYCELANDTINIPYTIRDVGRVYLCLGQIDSTQIYYDQALFTASKFNQKARLSILKESALNYKNQGDYNRAVQSIKEAIIQDPQNVADATYLNLGSSFFFLSQFDSAQYFLQKSCNSADPLTMAGSFYYLYKVAVEQRDYNKAVEYNEKYKVLSDSINLDNQKNEISELTYKYKQQAFKKEMELKVIHQHIFYGVVLFIFFVLLSGGAIFYLKQHWTMEQALRRKEASLLQEKELRKYSEQRLLENNQKIEQNEAVINEERMELQVANLKLLEYETKFINKENEIIQLKNEEKRFRNDLFKKSGFITRIQSAGVDKCKLDDLIHPFKGKEFLALEECLNHCYDHFVTRLQSQYPCLTQQEVEICCLLKACAKTKNISNIIAMTPNAVSGKKNKILTKMGLESDFTSLEIFLAHF